MLTFNHSGLLTPAGINISTLNEFEYEFAIKLNSEKRQILYKQYTSYCEGLKEACEYELLKQWIDGSYVTKTQNPSDIDVVSFIDYSTIKLKEQKLKQFMYPESKVTFGVDGYFIIVYPANNPLAYTTEHDKAYWIDHFDKTKPLKLRKRMPKGFLEINV